MHLFCINTTHLFHHALSLEYLFTCSSCLGSTQSPTATYHLRPILVHQTTLIYSILRAVPAICEFLHLAISQVHFSTTTSSALHLVVSLVVTPTFARTITSGRRRVHPLELREAAGERPGSGWVPPPSGVRGSYANGEAQRDSAPGRRDRATAEALDKKRSLSPPAPLSGPKL